MRSRRIVRIETRKELEELHEEFGEKLMEGMRAKVEEMVEVEVEKRKVEEMVEVEVERRMAEKPAAK